MPRSGGLIVRHTLRVRGNVWGPTFALALVLVLGGCAGQTTRSAPGAGPEPRRPASADSAWLLDSSNLDSAHRRQLDAYFSPRQPANFAQIKESLLGFDQDFENAGLGAVYQFDTLKRLGVPSGPEGFDFEAWEKAHAKNKRIARGMRLYVDDPADDSEQIWLSINKGLRSGNLAARLRQPLADILFAMENLPPIKGYLFRGTSQPVALLKEAEKGPVLVTEPGFSSTSVLPGVALRFANQLEETALKKSQRMNALLVIRGEGARPVSVFHREHSHEQEGLLAPGARFRFVRVVYDRPENPRNAVVFAELLSATAEPNAPKGKSHGKP